MLTLFWVGNILPVGLELKPRWLGAVLSNPELSWISFFCPLSDLFLSQIIVLYNLEHIMTSAWVITNRSWWCKEKKITKEKKEKRASVEKNIFEHMQNEMFWLRGERWEETCTAFAKTKPKWPYLYLKSSGHSAEVQLQCWVLMSACPSFKTGQRVLDIEFHSIEGLLWNVLELSSSWLSWTFFFCPSGY